MRCVRLYSIALSGIPLRFQGFHCAFRKARRLGSAWSHNQRPGGQSHWRKASRAAGSRPRGVRAPSQAIDCRRKVQKLRVSCAQRLTPPPPPRGWIAARCGSRSAQVGDSGGFNGRRGSQQNDQTSGGLEPAATYEVPCRRYRKQQRTRRFLLGRAMHPRWNTHKPPQLPDAQLRRPSLLVPPGAPCKRVCARDCPRGAQRRLRDANRSRRRQGVDFLGGKADVRQHGAGVLPGGASGVGDFRRRTAEPGRWCRLGHAVQSTNVSRCLLWGWAGAF